VEIQVIMVLLFCMRELPMKTNAHIHHLHYIYTFASLYTK